MTKDLIVARYNENLEWLNLFLDYDTVYIYDKSSDENKECLKNIANTSNIVYKKLNNVGREGHTYLWHIMNHREELADFNIFTQGEPFDHLIIKQIVTPQYFKKITDDYVRSELPFKGFGAKHYIWHVGLGGKRNDILKKLHSELFDTKFNENYKFNNGGIFGVSKKSIINRGPQFYQHIMDTPMSTQINPHEGFVLERLWVLIFGVNYRDKL